MYFIPRNNKFYNYIAHTSLKRCYLATLIGVCAFFMVMLYGIYYPLCSHIMILKTERAALQKKADEVAQLDKSNKELIPFIESGKKSIADRAITVDKKEEHCHKQMLFIMESIAQEGLTLTAYGSCKEKDKTWYIKNTAHFDVTGSLQKLLSLLEKIKEARQMITISHVTVTRLSDNNFQMGFDVGLVLVKK